MKCPKCGANMPEGALYCEKCGNEIHIVPDFEPEIEEAYRQTIDRIANDIWDNETAEEHSFDLSAKQNKDEKKKNKKALLLKIAIPIASVFLLVMAGIWIYFYNSADFQVNKARRLAEKGNYKSAIRYYERAVDLNDDINLKVELADAYFYRNNKMEYEYILWDIIHDKNASEEQIESAYGKLIAIYRSREDYQEINDFLLSSGNEAVISMYQMYVAREPEFSIKEGEYHSVQPLKLTASGEGKIYYTLDGSDPNENSMQYTIPIMLEKGSYIIKAYFVNSNGIHSNIAQKKYVVEIDELQVPVISIPSGRYTAPIDIKILGDSANIYYTTDGEDPDPDSSVYTDSIPMPLGSSVFKFRRIESGMSSDVVTCRYQLELETSLTPQDAEQFVVEYCMETGKILDASGRVSGLGATYEYQYQAVRNINGEGDFYIVAESIKQGNQNIKTGTFYAVDIYNGTLNRLSVDESGYKLTHIDWERKIPVEEEEEEEWEEE